MTNCFPGSRACLRRCGPDMLARQRQPCPCDRPARPSVNMHMRAFLIVLVSLYSSLSWSACPPHKFTEPAQVKLQGDSVMIVVHATSTYDARFSTKRGIDEAVRFAKGRKIPVVYLQDDTPEEFYFTEDCSPSYWVYSDAGEISFDIAPSHVYIV